VYIHNTYLHAYIPTYIHIQMLQDDEDRCEREALHILNQWQTMADVLLSGVLEINVHGAVDLPR